MKKLGRNVYFFGVGGVSMSGLAVMMKERGYAVGGFDEVENAVKILQHVGICVDFCLNEEHISEADCVICSSAIKDDNPCKRFAVSCGKKILTRGELLGMVSDEHEKVIAVAGSHGKTTTTALIFQILQEAGVNPTLHLGGFRVENGKNFHLGGKEFFVTEACEYCDNFLHLHPYVSVVTNVEKEHMDYFKTFSNQLKSFEKFKKQSDFVVEGFEGVVAKRVRHDKNGGLMFSLWAGKEKIMNVHMKICEEVNTQNCIYAYLVAKKLGIEDCVIKSAFENFKGVKTRFEKVECPHFDTVICDYAHHPTELAKAIETAKKIYKKKTLVTIFQPHTFSRTKNLLDDFVSVFKQLEMPLFFKTYSAREKPEDGVDAEKLSKIIKKNNKNAQYFENFASLFDFLQKLNRKNIVLLFLGAGDLPNILHKNNFLE